MAFPNSFVEELRNRVPVSSIVGKNVKLTRKGREFSGLCPFHNEKTPSFTVNDEKGFYHCFGCGAHGSGIDYIMQTENRSFPEAVETVAGIAGLAVPQLSPEARQAQEKAVGLRDLVEAAALFFERNLGGANGQKARSYLEQRGITPQIASQFRLGYSTRGSQDIQTFLRAEGFKQSDVEAAGLARRPDDGRDPYDFFRDRLMFAITDRQDRAIAFGGRILGDGNPKYLNSPDTPLFDKSATLYGIAQARQAAHAKGRIIVTEGYMDVIALAQAGIRECVAPLGTAVTERHVSQLWRLADEPVFCFDGDAAGQKAMFRAAERALPELKPGFSLKFAVIPPGEDPDSLVRKQGVATLNRVLEAARPLPDVLFDLGTGNRAPSTPDELASARQNLRNLAGKIENGDVKASYEAAFNERLSSYFYNRGSGKGQRGKSGNRFERNFGAAKIASMDPQLWQNRRRYELLLTGLDAHPALIGRHIEAIGGLGIPYEDLDQLRSVFIDAAFNHDPLDINALQCHLNETQGLADLTRDLRNKAGRLPDKWIRSKASLAEAEQGLVALLQLLASRA